MEVGGALRRECQSKQGWTECHMDGWGQMEGSPGMYRSGVEILVRGLIGSREDPLSISRAGHPVKPLQNSV